MEIKHYELDKINPAQYNPRTITEDELEALKYSIRKWGFVEPLVVNTRDGNNVLVGGHQRLKAAKSLSYIKLPVVEVDLSVAEEAALNTTLNSHTVQGKFDLEALPTVLEEIRIALPEEFKALRMNVLELDLKLNFDPLKAENKEIDTDTFGSDLAHTCPKCGFEFD